MSEAAAAVVIGAGPSGLVAATYLAKAGRRVVVLEADTMPGGSCANRIPVGSSTVPVGPHALEALDPLVVKDLKLTRLGLRFAARDLMLVALRGPLLLGRDVRAAKRSVELISPRDADRFAEFRRDLFAFARAMRKTWWDEGTPSDVARTDLRRLSVTSACSYLDAFEFEPLRAVFTFDAMAGGLPPSGAGSALVLAWRAAQEMCGLQGAVAIPLGGSAALVGALVVAAKAAGVEVRTGANVARLRMDGDALSGVVLATGEEVPASVVLSSLTRRRTLLEFLPTGAVGFAAAQQLGCPQEVGEAKLLLGLGAPPAFVKIHPAARFVIADRVEGCIDAHAEASAGRVPSELALEVVASTPIEAEGQCLLSVLIRPLPVTPKEHWTALLPRLVQTVVTALERYAPGLRANITALNFVAPRARDRLTVGHLLAPWSERIRTPVDGLYLCGVSAEPVPVVSGRAARFAAACAAQRLKRGSG
jgi:phytoene dehydrogenase-like protein